MSDTNTQGSAENDALWLESDSDWEGVGAYRLNPRYDHIEADVPKPETKSTP